MKDKLIKAFRIKFPELTISNERLVAFATKWETEVTDENEIETYLGNKVDVEVFKVIVSQDDAIRKSKTVEPEKKEEVKVETDKTDPNQALLDALEKLTQKVETLEKGKVLDAKTTSYKEYVQGLHDSVKIVANATDISNMSDDALEQFKTALTAQSEQLKVSDMSFKPKSGNGTPNNTSLSASEKAYLDSKKK